MATYNTNTAAGDVLSSSVAAAAAEHYERTAATTFIVPSTSAPLHLEPFVSATPHFVTSNAHHHHHHHQQTNSTSSSYTFVQIKREPCQVSEVTTSNNCHQQQHQHQQHQHTTTTTQQQHHGVGAASSSVSASATSKTMSSSTLTTLVKIEASSPKVQEMDKGSVTTFGAAPIAPSTNNSVPIGIAVARKRPQESSSTLANSTAIPMQQSLNKDMNCFGIRVADLGGVGSGCGNIYFTGNGDLMTGSTTAEELAISASGVQSVNRAPSTFWQYPNALPIESVISMSPTVGLQYSREASRGQVVLLPATAAALGISNYPLYTPTDPFQQAAAAFVWPSYIPQAPAAAAALQPPPNFIFPSMSPHSTLQSQPYATSLQLFGSNYLTAAAAAAAAAAATSTLCQHNQQTNSSSSINLSMGGAGSNSTASSSSSRYLSMATTGDTHKQHKQLLAPAPPPLLVPPTTMKIEEWNATEFMSAGTAAKTTTTTHQNHLVAPGAALNYGARDKTTTTTTTTTNLLELQGGNAQALNLMRLPTPPTSATMENASVAAAAAPQLQTQLLFQATTSATTPALLNLSASNNMTRVGVGGGSGTTNFLNNTSVSTIGPPTPIESEETALNFKTGGGSLDMQQQPQIVVGVPRPPGSIPQQPPPQMQDVNIQTDTPVCSEDENSSCPLAIHQTTAASLAPLSSASPTTMYSSYAHEQDNAQQPLELTKTNDGQTNPSHDQQTEAEANASCHSGGEETNEYAHEKHAERGPPMAADVNVLTASHCVEPVQTPAPEDLTGLELLSNISISTLAKSAPIRVKQEPLDHIDTTATSNEEPQSLIMHAASAQHQTQLVDVSHISHIPRHMEMQSLLPPPPIVEPLGGLNLLCALAEQRIQEEVQSSGSLFAQQSDEHELTAEHSPPNFSSFQQQQQSPFRMEPSFPSMDGIELPSTSAAASLGVDTVVKRKKHKHSKSSKSSGSAATSSKKSQRSAAKKNKKKYSKEKRKLKLQAAAAQQQQPGNDELDFDDDQLQEDLKSAFSCVDPNYNRCGGKWPNPQEIFSIMETTMRFRLAEVTRQYRKKKRKLDEISKNKKKKKCSKLAAAQQQQQQQISALGLANSSALSLAASSSAGNNTSSPLCDYKFSKFSKTTATSSSCTATSSYLQPSSFLRFGDKSQTHSQFPPAADVDQDAHTSSSSAVAIYKPMRLEPSSLAAAASAENNRGSACRKHASSERSTAAIVCKERKLMTVAARRHSSEDDEHNESTAAQQQQQQLQLQSHPMDRELTLTSEHLYRKETRVLTDMGGLFYAGIMKPLQPPDVYAITLDGERGNKSHIMSREEIFKDTILEVAPNDVDSVPVGTRLCAYWSQQYRCLYPGRAIESEASDDDTATHDFVSVEFDDGDSGRIRLQNIRLLLSNYPIAEYNDNPLYSLGKQKKSSVKSGNTSDPHHHDQSSSAAEDQHLSQANSATVGPSTSELSQTARELYAQRSEKKRIKNLKKKSLANGMAASAVIGNGSVGGGISGVSGGGDGSIEGNRKHHKHKKRKKHKKHHHRKTIIDAKGNTFIINTAASSSYVSKREAREQEEHNEEHDEEAEEDGEHHQAHELNATQKSTSAAIKLEATAAASNAVKVKTEHLDLEEETTSNLMSEVSDEVKGDDEVEHNNSKGSKIAAFLPERQLWGWLGKAYRKAGIKGRARKQFYKTIKRGKETITVGDCAVFLSTGRPDRPYIGRIESMWETTSSNKVVRVRWFYHPEETTGCPNLKFPGALFESPHEDENDVQTISHRCEVLPFVRYFAKFGDDSKQYQSIYDNNDTYYLAGYYNPRLQVLKLQDDIPTLEEQLNTTDV